MFRRLVVDTKAVTSMEYGLIATLVLVAISVALHNYGKSMGGMFNYVSGQISPLL